MHLCRRMCRFAQPLVPLHFRWKPRTCICSSFVHAVERLLFLLWQGLCVARPPICFCAFGSAQNIVFWYVHER
jgi:hypothetical protein